MPACLIGLDRLIDPSPFTFVSELVSKLIREMRRRGDRVSDFFAKFQSLNEARVHKDRAFFDGPVASVDSGLAANVEKVVQQRYFTDEHERVARQRCVEAFFEDLREACATQVIVVMLDSWERCNLSLRHWIVTELIGGHVLHPDVNLRPKKLFLVIAGRPYGPAGAPGLRPSDFRSFFDSNAEMDATVLSIAALSEWDKEHVRQFLELHGLLEPDEDELSFVQSRLRQGWSLEKMLILIDEHLRR